MDLKTWRQAHGFSVDQAASRFGIATPTLYNYENGSRRPRAAVAKRIEDATGGEVTAAELLGFSASGMREEPAQMEGASGQSVQLTLALPRRLLEAVKEYGLDAEALVLEGGQDRLEAEVRREFRERNAEAIEWSRQYVETHGTFGQRFGIFPTR